MTTAPTQTPAPNPTSNQVFGNFTATVLKPNADGVRLIKIVHGSDRPYGVPVEMAGLAAGKDAWMRDILVRCVECRTVTKAGDLQSGCYCETCVEKFEKENEEANR